ncbi:MAG: hypothetical protein RL127_1317 [Bacteroidota bacterium]|jgi:uncharacterized protein (TIGR02145 family)
MNNFVFFKHLIINEQMIKYLFGLGILCALWSCQKDGAMGTPCSVATFEATVKSPTKITLNWGGKGQCEESSPEITVGGVYIYRKTLQDADFQELINLPASFTSYTDSLLKPNTEYTYKIQRWADLGRSLPKTVVATTSALPLPSSPGAVVTGGYTTTSITVSWLNNAASSAAVPVTGTKVFRKMGAETTYTQIAALSDTARSYVDKGLTPDTEYTYQVYRYNNYGNGPVGTSATVRTNKQAAYAEVTISGKTWMLNNLDVTTYRNGDVIPEIKNLADWNAATTGAWCYYNFVKNDGTAVWGKLYNKFAVDDPRGLAPVGWHIPTKLEWLETITAAGPSGAGKLKVTTSWKTPIASTNSLGFSAYPAGGIIRGQFESSKIMTESYFWTKAPAGSDDRFYIYFNAESNDIGVYPDVLPGGLHGFSVRCRKDL